MKFSATQIMVALSLTVITDDRLSIFPLLNFAKLFLAWGWLTGQVKRVERWFSTQTGKLVHCLLASGRGPVWWAIG